MDTMAKTAVGAAVVRKGDDYRNPRLPINERVSDLLGRMTLEEKTAQMLCVWRMKDAMLFDQAGEVDLGKLRTHMKEGCGQIARPGDSRGGLSAQRTVEITNALQRFFVEETRLGIPVIFHEECLHGLVGENATSYPQPIGLASTFDPELVEQIYSTIAEDARSRGIHQALTPVVDVARDPRWGRTEETFGEDPFLVARMGVAAVRGFQGDGGFKDKKHIIATLKHFAAHGQPESGMNCAPANYSERVLRDVFLYPFKEALEKGGAVSVMASYNEIDGIPSHANRWLLRDVLRKEWGFQGYVVSDYFAITELHDRPEATSHAVAQDKSEAALLAVKAGVNVETPDPDCYSTLRDLVRNGRLDEGALDELVRPILFFKFRLGLFEDPFVNPEYLRNGQGMENEKKLALQAARETITLLKNSRQILPLQRKKGNSIAVIGPNADRVMLGGYSGVPPQFVTVLDGVKKKIGSEMDVLFAEGCKITVGGSWNEDRVVLPDPAAERGSIAAAVETARNADSIVLVLGGNEQTSREAWGRNHLGDRSNIDLPGMQNDLVRAIAELGKPFVVVLFNGRPNSIVEIQEKASAILECWYLGQECGQAVADVLFGDYNPGGKLPITIPRSAGHVPCFYNYKPSARRGYLFGDVTPLYPFGFGLSYTSFQFSNVKLDKSSVRTDEPTRLSLDVTNTGPRAGVEVVQLYIRDCVSSVTRPIKELRGFQRVSLKSRESKTVSFAVVPEMLAFTNIDMEFTTEPGDFELMVGNSSQDGDLQKVVLHVTP